MGYQRVAARMEAGSSTDNRVTVGMRKISDVRTLVILLNGSRRIKWPIHVTGNVSRIIVHLRCISTIDH